MLRTGKAVLGDESDQGRIILTESDRIQIRCCVSEHLEHLQELFRRLGPRFSGHEVDQRRAETDDR